AATAVSPRSCEPAGSSTCTSTDSPPPRKVYCLQFLGALISSLPPAYSTRVCSAAVTSAFLVGSLGRTSTMVSVRSLATIRRSPTPNSTVTEIGSGVSKIGICSSFVGWLACPARVVLGPLGGAPFGSTGRAGSFQGGGGRPHEPGVDRQPLARGRLLDPGLEVVGHAEVDPRHAALVALWNGWGPAVGILAQVVGGLVGRGWCHHELGVASTQAQLDRSRRELGVALPARRRQRVLQGEPDPRLQRRDQPLGERPSLVTA